MKRHDMLKALRRIRKALSPGERYELIIHTPDGIIVKYVGCNSKEIKELADLIEDRQARLSVAELADRVDEALRINI